MNNHQNSFEPFAEKMRGAEMSDAAIRAFRYSYETLASGKSPLISEHEIQPVEHLPSFAPIRSVPPSPKTSLDLLSQTVVIKLNGGLGTGMGLEKAKSLLPIKDGLTFLDFIVKQILFLRNNSSSALRFLLMNSFSTSEDTLHFLARYPELGNPKELELMQNQVPKVDAASLKPAEWPANRSLEWCPPGHGDLYPALLGSGWLERLRGDGIKFAFVSNSDNLGATLDPALLKYFAQSDSSFLMEVAIRTASDRKGGHLARRAGKLLLRESAQCPESDAAAFQDINRHRFFNTNSIWLRLDRLAESLARGDGFIPLPVIRNGKTVDPRDKNSPAVFQLETAMGAAIESFPDAQAILVPRSRFSPVKSTSDLLALRSDAYQVTDDWRLELAQSPDGTPPTIDLDPTWYKLTDQLDRFLSDGIPSLKNCRELSVRGPIIMGPGNHFAGKVVLTNPQPVPSTLPDGHYCDTIENL